MSKTVYIVLGVLLLLVLVTIGTGWWWFNTQGRDYFRSAQVNYAQGQVAGASLDEKGCFDAAVEVHRSSTGSSMGGALKNGLHLSGCLDKSRVLPSFCEGVPAPNEFMAAGKWQHGTCAKFGFKDQFCPQLVAGVADYCFSPARAAKLKPAG